MLSRGECEFWGFIQGKVGLFQKSEQVRGPWLKTLPLLNYHPV
jgi:hypothetical protein